MISELGLEKRSPDDLVGLLTHPLFDPFNRGLPLELSIVRLKLQVRHSEEESNPIGHWQRRKGQQSNRIHLANPPAHQIRRLRLLPDQPVAESKLLDQAGDHPIGTKQVVVKFFEVGPADWKGPGQSADDVLSLEH